MVNNYADKCVGCNRCVRVCPINEANITRENETGTIVEVDGGKCIGCGACLLACHHDARYYEDDTRRFFEDLKRGEPISMFAAPSVKTHFFETGGAGRLFAWLRRIGVRQIFDVSLGADICTWAHIRHIQKNGPKPMITQPCPAIVNYILMYKNELVKYLSPIHSPMLCTAIFMRKYEKVNTKIAALSPCVAKAHEFEATRLVDYNVTISHLLEYIEDNHIVFPMEESGFDSYQAGLGTLYSIPGCLEENVEHYLGKSLRIDKSEGQQVIYKALDEYAVQPESRLPVIFDVLNCPEGCNIGTGCRQDRGAFEINAIMDNYRQDSISEDNLQYLNELYERFDETLRLEDFVRRYSPAAISPIRVTDAQVEEAFTALGKFDEVSKHFDCGACGCDTCLGMAQKVAKGIDTPSSCAKKIQEEVQRENMEFIEMQSVNLSNLELFLKDSTQIKVMTEDIKASLTDITESISAYNRMIADIEKIALQVNIISLNASIEASRAGQYGRAFGVVAEEIRSLAKSSNVSAERTKDASVKATGAIKGVNEMMAKISENVNASHDNISEITEKMKSLALSR